MCIFSLIPARFVNTIIAMCRPSYAIKPNNNSITFTANKYYETVIVNDSFILEKGWFSAAFFSIFLIGPWAFTMP